MLHACAVRLDVMGNLESFWILEIDDTVHIFSSISMEIVIISTDLLERRWLGQWPLPLTVTLLHPPPMYEHY